MARIRTIKPEFFASADIADLSPMARLLFVFLWLEADREGRLRWNPRNFRLRFFPSDDYTIDDLATELVESELVVVYENEGERFAEIPTFNRHQVINNRESDSEIPPHDADASARVGHASARVKAEGRNGRNGRERKGTGKEENKEQRVRTRKSLFDPSSVDLPFDSIEFRECWSDWIQHRREIRKPLTATSAKQQLAKFENWGEPRSIAAIKHTIANGWVGLREADIANRRFTPGSEAEEAAKREADLRSKEKRQQALAKRRAAREELPS